MKKYQSDYRTIVVSALVVCTGIAHEVAAIPPAYRVTDLGTLGGTESQGWGINSSGQVTGFSFTAGNAERHAFLYDGTMHDLGTLGGGESHGFGINAIGQVAGWSYTTRDGGWHAFLYDGTMHDLGTLGGLTSQAYSINNSGHVVGWATLTGELMDHAFLHDGAMHDLGTLGGTRSSAYGINDSGQVTGWSLTTGNDAEHAFLYEGTMHDLGTLGGTFSAGYGINDYGQITGTSYTAGNEQHAFLWTPLTPHGVSGTMQDLGTLGGALSEGRGINGSGHVVGSSTPTGTAPFHAFIYTSGRGMVDLNTLIDPLSGWHLMEATAINDAGQIAGNGWIGGEHHAFLLAPVPEPATLALLALALPLLVRRNSRRPKHCVAVIPASFAALVALFAPVVVARADIFQWEYINPADPSQGKQQSTMLAPDGAGRHAVRGTYLSGLDLTKAYLIAANVGPEILSYDEYGYPMDYVLSNLTNVILRQADLSHAYFLGASLTGADLTGAEVRGTFFGSSDGSFYYGGTGITLAQLYSTASYQARDLTGISLVGYTANNSLAGIDLAGQNLTGAWIGASIPQANLSQANLRFASFEFADLTGANLTGAEVRNAYIGGLTTAQLYSTASYQAHDLTGIALPGSDLTGANLSHVKLTGADLRTVLDGANLTHANLTGANFSGNYFYWGGADLSGANLSHANLTNADFSGDHDSPGANLTNANLTGADARGAGFFRPRMDGAITTNLIQSDGHVDGLDLTGGATLVVRDYDGNPGPIPNDPLPIAVEEHLAMDATGTLRLVLDADAWDSTISFAPGIPVTLGGTLELIFAPEVDVAAQGGRTIDLFDWTGVAPTGSFTVSSSYDWDLSQLYTSGEVTLLGAPGSSGDFDLDGDSDGADFLAWQRGFRSAFNAGHLATWGTAFGRTAGGAALASTHPASQAPEPASWLLLTTSALWLARRLIARRALFFPEATENTGKNRTGR